MRLAAIALVVLLQVFSISAAEPWPEFRGPHGDGRSSAKNLPLTWSEKENVRWKTPTEGRAWSSPVVWGDQIWLSNATPDGKRLSGICVEATSGKIIRNLLLFEIAKPQPRHNFNSYASPTPAIEAGRVYLHFGSPGTVCLDTKTSAIVWQRQDLPCDHLRGPGSSPILWNDFLILTFDGVDFQYLVALDKRTGKTIWKTDRKIDYGADKNSNGDFKKGYSTPSVKEIAGMPTLVSVGAAATVAYDARDGKELWRAQTGGYNSGCRPLFLDDLVIGNSEDGMQLFAIRTQGRGDITSSNIAWTYARSAPARSSPLVVGDLVFAMSNEGVLSCLDGKTGKAIWQKRLEGDYSASALYVDGRIYYCSQDGLTTVIAADREFKKLSENQLDEGFMASPAVIDGALILRTRTHLYRIEVGQSESR
jgi:outer membrane protein assembly factor BamB